MNITHNVELIKNEISAAAAESGRGPEEITLVAATKMNDAAAVREAIAAGVPVCGENRVQEMLEKNSQNAYAGSRLHFIGHLQKNKVRQVVGVASLIQSVDSLELLELIGKTAASRKITQDILLEINIGNEASKSGFSPEEIPSALEFASSVSGITVRGLMAIPPACKNPEQSRPFFDAMRQLFIDNKGKKYDNVRMDFLSMGMSSDFKTAIACGSNMVRIGTGIFGPRNYQLK